MAVVALGAIIGGLDWVTDRASDPALVADGSLVPADVPAYKELPKDPGGKTFDGTGDTVLQYPKASQSPRRSRALRLPPRRLQPHRRRVRLLPRPG